MLEAELQSLCSFSSLSMTSEWIKGKSISPARRLFVPMHQNDAPIQLATSPSDDPQATEPPQAVGCPFLEPHRIT